MTARLAHKPISGEGCLTLPAFETPGPGVVFRSRMRRRSVGCYPLRFLLELTAQLFFQGAQLRFDFLIGFALADDLVAVAPQEVIDGLDANPDRTGRLILVEIL